MADKEELKNGFTQLVKEHKAPLLHSARLSVTILAFFGCLITYILRLNMGFAMVCMVQKKSMMDNINDTEDICYEYIESSANATETKMKEFDWDKSLQGYLLGAFFYGYIVTQAAAGWLCEKIGGKIVLATGLGTVSVLTLAIPEASRVSPYFLLTVRTLQGMFAAVSFPAIHTIVGGWAPPSERGFLMSIAYSGMYVGTLITFPSCGLLCDYGFAGGWPSVFYVSGALGLVWVIGVVIFVFDNPEKHPRISTEEKLYLQKNLEQHHSAGSLKPAIPWKKIFTSAPVWAITLSHVSANWGLYTLAVNLPTYMDEVHRFKIKENGFLSSLPYICTLIMHLICGKLTDFLRRKNIPLTTLRKTFNSIGMIVPGICMFVLTFLNCTNRYAAVATVTLLQATGGLAYSGGFFYNHVDIAPQYAGILMGITNTFGTIPGILSPILVGILTPDGTLEQWAIVFYIGMVLYFIGAISYIILGSGERQSWALEEEKPKEPEVISTIFNNLTTVTKL